MKKKSTVVVGVAVAVLLLYTRWVARSRSLDATELDLPHPHRGAYSQIRSEMPKETNDTGDKSITHNYKRAPLTNGASAEKGRVARRKTTEAERQVKQKERGKLCRPSTHVVFLKMHKCGSSTVQNIMLRYGEEHRLNFALPLFGHNLPRQPFNRSHIMPFPVKKYDIVCHHTIFSAEGIAEAMPKDSVYVTILRDPVPMFESVFTYTNRAKAYGLPESRAMELFFERPQHFYEIQSDFDVHFRNPMLRDLGLPKASMGEGAAEDRCIEEARRRFDLVMLTEHFEESLVLLKEALCWETDDVAYFTINARSGSATRARPPPRLADSIRRWNRGDVELYDAFNRTFWRRVEAFGSERMRREVQRLRERNRYFLDRCVSGVTNSDPKVWHPQGVSIESFQLKPGALNDPVCVRMTRTEVPYTDHIRKLQRVRFSKKRDGR